MGMAGRFVLGLTGLSDAVAEYAVVLRSSGPPVLRAAEACHTNLRRFAVSRLVVRAQRVAGAFDGVFLAGLIAVLLAAACCSGRPPRSAAPG
jgi:hypothetical protein